MNRFSYYLTILLGIVSIYCTIKLSYSSINKEIKEGFTNTFDASFKRELIKSLSSILNISTRRINNIRYIVIKENPIDEEVGKISVEFSLLPKNEIETNEPTNKEVHTSIKNLLDSNALYINVGGKRTKIIKMETNKINNGIESFQNNASINNTNGNDTNEMDPYSGYELDSHLRFINENMKQGSPVNHNLERYFTVDFRTGNLIEPEPVKIYEVEAEIEEELLDEL